VTVDHKDPVNFVGVRAVDVRTLGGDDRVGFVSI
jgi:hypothetical protein